MERFALVSPLASNDDYRSLFELQETDQKLRRVHARLEDLEERRALSKARSNFERFSAKRDRLLDDLSQQNKRLNRLELELQSVESELASIESRLFGGEVTVVKELKGLESKAQSQKERKDQLEEEILTLMETIQALEEEIDKGNQVLEVAADKVRELESVCARAEAEINREIELLEENREKLTQKLAPEAVRLYESLAKSHGGRPIAAVEDRLCGGCRVELPTSFRAPQSGKTVHCPSCGRLLWFSN